MFTYCPSWPQELQDAERRRYRAACRVRCPESSLDHIDPADFDQVMDQLETAIMEAQVAGTEVQRLMLKQATNTAQK